MIPIARLHELLRLDIETGKLFWRVKSSSKIRVGAEAGCRGSRGYVLVRVDGVLLKGHRIVFALVNNRWPTLDIDHINGVTNDNRPCNLREATVTQNLQNARLYTANKSGHKGVYWDNRTNSWRAEICSNGKTLHLGRFVDLETAASVRANATSQLHGEFARLA
jgi:hypothetical protein